MIGIAGLPGGKGRVDMVCGIERPFASHKHSVPVFPRKKVPNRCRQPLGLSKCMYHREAISNQSGFFERDVRLFQGHEE
jgi:hypothetical protein